ncbi:MAG: transposase [Verrucomicrobiales bacterium]
MDDDPVRRMLPHAVPSWVPDASLFFITICCLPRGENQLCQSSCAVSVLDLARFYHESNRWFCPLCVLMPDHLHAVAAFSREPGMEETIANLKRYLARIVGIVWQRDFFDHRLRSLAEQNEKIDYIRRNPVRQGLCQIPEEWPWIFEGDGDGR